MLSVLSTKLSKPQLPTHIISREALLGDCDWARLILVSSQAGSGKSTVVSSWLSAQSKPNCWYGLDDWDNDLMQFLTYLTAGLRQIDDQAAADLAQILDAFQAVGFEAFLKALINQLHTIKFPYIIVFDDYQAVRNEMIHRVIKTICTHMPPMLQLVIVSREDPPLPLAKMRAGGKLLEVRMSQLRFTEDEVKAYFVQQLRLSLKEEQVRQIIARTEGWAAGLQMIALSLRGNGDIDSFIATFADNHQYIMDYLLEEVLERQTPEIKQFLLRTAVLDLFTADLCDVVAQLPVGSAGGIIEKLLKTNSFIIAAELSRHWFRYHHLFRDILRQRLEREAKGETADLHRLAGQWFERKGYSQEAIRHFLQANAIPEAAALIECQWAEMDMQLQSASWLEMARKLPVTILEGSPVLSMGYGWALLDLGDVAAGLEWLDKARSLYERHQTEAGPDELIVNDTAQYALLPATIASAYGYIAASTGDVAGMFRYAGEALERFPADQHIKRSNVNMLLGFAHWQQGDLDQAETLIVSSINSVRRAGNPLVEHSYGMVLGELYIRQGALAKARELLTQTIDRLKRENIVAILLPSLYLGLAKIAFLQGDNGQAKELLEESRKLGQQSALMDWKYKYYLLLARIYGSEGLIDLARECILESRLYYHMNPVPEDVGIDDVARQIESSLPQTQHRPLLPGSGQIAPAFKKEHSNQALPEPLTVREMEVLALIEAGLSNQEICDTLFLALSTVKGYNQNIFRKLDVSRRTQAVARAMELGLV